MRHTSKTVYTVHAPYATAIADTTTHAVFTPMTDADYRAQAEFESLTLQWCLKEKYIVRYDPSVPLKSSSAVYRANITSVPSLLNQVIYKINFRSLLNAADLENLIGILGRDNDTDLTFNKLLNFYLMTVSVVDTSYLDKYVTRFYQTMESLRAGTADLTCAELHTRYPYLWILAVIQRLMHHTDGVVTDDRS